MKNLRDLLPEQLKADLTPAEERLLGELPEKGGADFRTGDKEIDDPAKAGNWGPDRTIRAEFIRFLCIDKKVAELLSPEGIAIWGVRIDDRLYLEDCHIRFKFGLFFSHLENVIGLDRAKTKTFVLIDSWMRAVSANGLECDGLFSLMGAKIKSEVDLVGAAIQGNLNCDRVQISNGESTALDADTSDTKGSVFLQGANIIGKTNFNGAKIGGVLDCRGAVLENPEGVALQLQNSTIKHDLWLTDGFRCEGMLVLSSAKIGCLVDEERSWPKKGSLYMDGFVYSSIAPGTGTPTNASTRIKWLELQPDQPFYPQPYTYLAKVFREQGKDSEARKVLIARERRRRKFGGLKWYEKIWSKVHDLTTGYGYAWWKPLRLVGVLILVGFFAFDHGWEKGAIRPIDSSYSDSSTLYPQFSSFMYSADACIPLIDFRQEKYWLPDATTESGHRLLIYYWIHVFLGWFLVSLAIAIATGIMQKEK